MSLNYPIPSPTVEVLNAFKRQFEKICRNAGFEDQTDRHVRRRLREIAFDAWGGRTCVQYTPVFWDLPVTISDVRIAKDLGRKANVIAETIRLAIHDDELSDWVASMINLDYGIREDAP